MPRLALWPGSRKNLAVNPLASGARYIVGNAETPHASTMTTMAKVLSGNSLSVHDFLLHGARHVVHAATSSAQKAEFIGLLDDFCAGAGVREHIIDELAEIFDELYTNALYHAPIENGVRPNSDKDRSVDVASRRAVTITFGADPTTVVLSVRDEYGSLSADRVVESIGRCFGSDGPQLSETGGGAGVGMFMMLQKASYVALNIAKGRSTEVIVARDLTQSRRDFTRSAPSLVVHERAG
ncbi:MAG TPA: hypothetical protein VLC93_14270, partial [Myxococcota bacterium]|nr:hypothetical protein [Myxococcota bacterium]